MLTDALKTQIKDSFDALKNDMHGFKIRPSQNKMIAEIAKTLTGEYDNNHKILCVEAPTGTGKTFAYLLSAIPIAKANKHKLIVSSANVALQEQLLVKDVPEAQKYCAVDFEYALVKGRSRYVCIRNLINLVEENVSSDDLFDTNMLFDAPPGKHQLEHLNTLLTDYSNKKWNGEIDDLTHMPDHNMWQKVACSRWTCTAKSCDFYNDCAFFKARKQVSRADVIIANHDLILADLNAGNTVLPDVNESIYIFDEAHHLSGKALTHFSLSSGTEFIKNTVKQTESLSEQLGKLTQCDPLNIDLKQVNEYLTDLVQSFKSLNFDEGVYLFNQGVIDENIKFLLQNLSNTMTLIQSKFETLKQSWSDYLKINTVDKNTVDPLTNALGECDQSLCSIVVLFSSMLRDHQSGESPHARWVEKAIQNNKKINYILNSAQTDIANNLHNLIWSKAAGVILTSATLSSLGSFNRLNQQLGLVRENNQYLRLPSPFVFDKVDFIVAKFHNNPTQIYEHTQEVATQLLKRIDYNTGSLVLFASNKQMQLVADLMEKKLGCALWVQGEFSKKLILEKHTNLRNQNKGSVIFGLDSFAEGVDLKGNTLTHVIIAKLRFSVPSSPIDKTLATYLQSQNRNPFMEVSLPDASLKLIQACGRLIRTENDEGKITIFDNRLVGKFYGKQLLNALPNYNIVVEH